MNFKLHTPIVTLPTTPERGLSSPQQRSNSEAAPEPSKRPIFLELLRTGKSALRWRLQSLPGRLAVLVFLLFSVSYCPAAFRAGIAFRNVTPDPLLPVSGGVGASHPVTRKEGELTVRALVL